MPRIGGIARAGARRESERRRDESERRVRERHPVIGGAMLAVAEAPQRELAWERGAEGEERVAAALAKRCNDDVCFLYDRRLPMSRASVDIIAVGPTGIWVIDPNRRRGRLSIERRLRGPARLRVAGRDQTELVDGLDRRLEVVRNLIAPEFGPIEVHGALCFVDTELPWVGSRRINGHWVLPPRALAKRLNAAGKLAAETMAAAASFLDTRLPAA